jgi:DNA-binding HxlR family transcriptional regulator
MGQKEVEDVLKKFHNEALSISDIVKQINGKINKRVISRAVKQLEKYGEVKSIQLTTIEARKRYGLKFKRKVKVYYID